MRVCLVVTAAVIALALLAAGSTPHADAAPCPAPTVSMTSGHLSIEGTTPCDDEQESFTPYCEAGTVRVWFDYFVNGVSQGPVDTGIGCAQPVNVIVTGHAGDDTIDLSRVVPAQGFAGVSQANVADGGSNDDTLIASPAPTNLSGGTQNDMILARNGAGDSIDCGAGLDAVQADQLGVDSLANCEITDFAASPAPPATGGETTGKRAAALRRCHRIHERKRRRRCIRHAQTLPV